MPESTTLYLRSCGACGTVEAGARNFCSRCGSAALEPTTVEGRGRINSWTVVRRPAAAFQHLGIIRVIMVSLADGTVVTGRFEGQPEALRVGADVALAHEQDGVSYFRAIT